LAGGALIAQFGVYFWADGRRLPVVAEGIPMGDFLFVEEPFLEIED